MAAEQSSDFDVRLVTKYFTESRRENGDIGMREYIEGYKEWCKFFGFFGTIFSFVTSDVKAKLTILENYQKSDSGKHYETVQSMIAYETESGMIKGENNIKGKGTTGARTLLRLHRALKFCYRLIEEVIVMKKKDKMSNVAWDVYNDTLAEYHMWIIRKGVGVAMYGLPTKSKLFEKAGAESDEEGEVLMQAAVDSISPVYEVVQDVYESNDILNLP